MSENKNIHVFKHLEVKNHNWEQRGNWIECSSCINHHAFWLNNGQMLAKNSKGEYVILEIK